MTNRFEIVEFKIMKY